MSTAIGAQAQVGSFPNYPCPPSLPYPYYCTPRGLDPAGPAQELLAPATMAPAEVAPQLLAPETTALAAEDREELSTPETTALAAEDRAVDEMARGPGPLVPLVNPQSQNDRRADLARLRHQGHPKR